MVDTTAPKASIAKPLAESAKAGAPEAEIEVTPEMIEAGVQIYYENACEGWASPGGNELRRALAEIYVEMAKCAPKSCGNA
jgi:hypothetical protein